MEEEIKDLDIIFPDEEIMVTFTGKEDRKKYQPTKFIPHGLSLFMAKHGNMNSAEKNLKYIMLFLQAQYPHMDEQWIQKNVSLQKQTAILGGILKEVGRANDFLPKQNQEFNQAMIMEMAKKMVEQFFGDPGEKEEGKTKEKPAGKMLS
jgi:hypothetical protein